ncbi:hypothetical protein B0J11DRAFT_520345 [Dendryphion nanum]|uniref:gamma-glutamylcyclotransferase n=1 Tax=Dendryphion nanum TaxID=256645 RepID=A0A9P9E8K2_9PLEO|nr:hypothetical protein B0J11DRAFT_520345 [Dendryphion nanum]
MEPNIDIDEVRAALLGQVGVSPDDTGAGSTPSNDTQSSFLTESSLDHHVRGPPCGHAKRECLVHCKKNHDDEKNPLLGKFVSPASSSASDANWRDNATIDRGLSAQEHAPERHLPLLPPPSQDRLAASLNEQPLELGDVSSLTPERLREKEETYLYLAYGSNLCVETFRGVRGIQPISQINVVVPTLRLTFDLPGIPYSEPCFANSAFRDPDVFQQPRRHPVWGNEYHKDRWQKGLVGCVYEVTAADYAHIIASEGGGASYRDIVVECFPLDTTGHNHVVPLVPTTKPFKAHTLFSPAVHKKEAPAYRNKDRISRPNPSYAQPSARYLKLITDGALELDLPYEYRQYLSNIRPYTITRRRQKWGHRFFMFVIGPLIFFIFALQRKFQGPNGRSPKWLVMILNTLFVSVWTSYDLVLKRVFGDGERTEGQDEEDAREPVRWMAEREFEGDGFRQSGRESSGFVLS